MTVPYVAFPNPWKILLDLLRLHEHLPAALQPAATRVCATLPDTYPGGCPYLQVVEVPGAGPRPVPLRLASAAFDLNVYDVGLFNASQLAGQIADVAASLEQRSTAAGGFTQLEVETPFPFPTGDPEVLAVYRYVVPIRVTYRPA